ncbi:hypothetical protein CONCODRAFT_84777 [Conidiobolus coronatus NRRL 28638]|uniref:Uncharacterized protein n=1 Tax=Conidiobolus coronatus (strain ATCC 28846 / CBS 209.66 / NRRL 28638) TaxID=796925 RepID=A0A137P8L8_CONC2|nr:hypothetical protein CONCODRAFT_84777 [Conidiobolus coronatus NRRL 28638]|eukprot:KXN71294.1 hypothetical protein CONCODRAFT_84777 [Conidiobolus coronatus NRRL 28638]
MINTIEKIISHFDENYLRNFKENITVLTKEDIQFINSKWKEVNTLSRLRISLNLYLLCIADPEYFKENNLIKFTITMSKDTDPLVKIISNSIKNYDKLKDVKLNDFSNKISVNSIIVYLTNQVDKLPVQESKIHKSFLDSRLMDDIVFREDTIHKNIQKKKSALLASRGAPASVKRKYAEIENTAAPSSSEPAAQQNPQSINQSYISSSDAKNLFGSVMPNQKPQDQAVNKGGGLTYEQMNEAMDINRAKEKLGWRTIVNKPTQVKNLIDVDLQPIANMVLERLTKDKEKYPDISTYRYKPTQLEQYEIIKQSSIFKEKNCLSNENQDRIINFILKKFDNELNFPPLLDILMDERDIFNEEHQTSFTQKTIFYGCKSTVQWKIVTRYF